MTKLSKTVIEIAMEQTIKELKDKLKKDNISDEVKKGFDD